MGYDRDAGLELMESYLGADELATKLEHSQGVGDFAYIVARRISERHPELGLDPELVGYLGYVHDIGYAAGPEKHELASIDLLLEEGVDPAVARMVMHGQLAEQYGEAEGDVEQYLPIGLEGMLLTYADMSVRVGRAIPVRERAAEIEDRVNGLPIPQDIKDTIIENLHKAMPRFERYEEAMLALAGAGSVDDFYEDRTVMADD